MKRTLLAMSLALLASGPVLATDAGEESFARTLAETQTQIEEFVVSGRLQKLSELRKAITDAENRVYNRYNELNTNDRYDIECRTEAPTGHRLKLRGCEPRYISDAQREAAVDGLRTTNGNVRLLPRSAIVTSRVGMLQANMRQIAASDPEFQRALIEYTLLNERYKMLRDQKLKDHVIVWD